MSRTAIRCNCGQRIGQKEVTQTGHYPRMFGPSFVFVRHRCSRCRKFGEQFVKQEEWDAGILRDSGIETTSKERDRLAALGPIAASELAAFHNALESLGDLSSLVTEFGEAQDTHEDNTNTTNTDKTDKSE